MVWSTVMVTEVPDNGVFSYDDLLVQVMVMVDFSNPTHLTSTVSEVVLGTAMSNTTNSAVYGYYLPTKVFVSEHFKPVGASGHFAISGKHAIMLTYSPKTMPITSISLNFYDIDSNYAMCTGFANVVNTIGVHDLFMGFKHHVNPIIIFNHSNFMKTIVGTNMRKWEQTNWSGIQQVFTEYW